MIDLHVIPGGHRCFGRCFLEFGPSCYWLSQVCFLLRQHYRMKIKFSELHDIFKSPPFPYLHELSFLLFQLRFSVLNGLCLSYVGPTEE
jgi:hypothetical protein